jgi:sugar-specific transcriptional regulator TrmB
VAPGEKLSDALSGLGFSRYESRAYAGLLAAHGQTAYALSKSTGIPTPKIYEALQKLVERGAAVLTDDSPQRFAAVPLEEILGNLERQFRDQVADVRQSAEELAAEGGDGGDYAVPVRSVAGRDRVLAEATARISRATRKIYLSAWATELQQLSGAIRAAEARGVTIIALTFGRTRFELGDGRVFRHDSTSKAVYVNHQHRHLALVADSEHALWALAPDGKDWTALVLEDNRMVGLVRTFIRHDIYVQRIYAELGPEMKSVFGAGLEFLTDLLAVPDPGRDELGYSSGAAG